MDHDSLALFLHLSRTLHFGRTARERHVSPSALSRTIARMEDRLGAPLFERDRRTVRLTAAGLALQAHATRVLDDWQALARRLARRGQALSGELSLFASVTACQTFLPRILAAFRAAHPEVRLRLETGYAQDALAVLARGAVDAVVAALPERIPASLQARVVLVTPLVFVAPASECEASRLCQRRPVPWAELPVVLPAAGLARAAADRWFRKRRVTPRLYGEVAGNEAMLSLVSLGCGVGIVPRIVAEQSPLRGEVRVLPAEPALPPLRVGVCTRRAKLTLPVVQAFWDSLGGAAEP